MEPEIFFQKRKGGRWREIVNKRQSLFSATIDPPREKLNFGIGELRFPHGRHVFLVIERQVGTPDHQAGISVTRLEGRAVLSAREEQRHGIHAQVSIALRGVVTLHALGFDDRLDRRDVDGRVFLGAFIHGDRLGFSTEGDWEIGGEVILAVGERSTIVTGRGNEAKRSN